MTARSGGLAMSSEAAMSRTLVATASRTGAPSTPSRRARRRNLVDRLLAGDVGGGAAARRDGGRRLQQQRRFADAGIAADEDRRARHEAAAADAVQFGDAGQMARRAPAFAVQWDEIERRPGRPCRCRARLFGGPVRANSSTMLFHAPQASQRPAHFG